MKRSELPNVREKWKRRRFHGLAWNRPAEPTAILFSDFLSRQCRMITNHFHTAGHRYHLSERLTGYWLFPEEMWWLFRRMISSFRSQWNRWNRRCWYPHRERSIGCLRISSGMSIGIWLSRNVSWALRNRGHLRYPWHLRRIYVHSRCFRFPCRLRRF